MSVLPKVLYFKSKQSIFPSFFSFSLPHSHLSFSFFLSFFLSSFFFKGAKPKVSSKRVLWPAWSQGTNQRTLLSLGLCLEKLDSVGFPNKKMRAAVQEEEISLKNIYPVNIEVTGDIAVSLQGTQCHRGQIHLVSGHHVPGRGEVDELFSASS